VAGSIATTAEPCIPQHTVGVFDVNLAMRQKANVGVHARSVPTIGFMSTTSEIRRIYHPLNRRSAGTSDDPTGHGPIVRALRPFTPKERIRRPSVGPRRLGGRFRDHGGVPHVLTGRLLFFSCAFSGQQDGRC